MAKYGAFVHVNVDGEKCGHYGSNQAEIDPPALQNVRERKVHSEQPASLCLHSHGRIPRNIAIK